VVAACEEMDSCSPLVSCTEKATGLGVVREREEAAVGANCSISPELLKVSRYQWCGPRTLLWRHGKSRVGDGWSS
jgi:hypothetical protein